MYCPFRDEECYGGCALWSPAFEACAFLLIGEGVKEVGFVADDANLDCAIRVRIAKEDRE